MVSIHRPLGYGPSTLPLRHPANCASLISDDYIKVAISDKGENVLEIIGENFTPTLKVWLEDYECKTFYR